MDQHSIGGDNIQGDKVSGDKVLGDKIYGDKKIYHFSDKDAVRNQRIRSHLLNQLQATWLQGVLENNLFEVTRLELGLESQSDAVERPWIMSLERPNHPTETLLTTSKILDTYHDLGEAMLILGEPGSGKTITLLELARELRRVALKDDMQPTPLVFNLSSWAEKRPSLLDWLAGELFTIYGIPPKKAAKWLKKMPVHLLLDGLDEVAFEHREACIQAINTFKERHGPVNIVVCSRTADYNQLTTQLNLMGAVLIQPLTNNQINAYLTAASPHLTQMVANDPSLQELAQTPLTLNIIALTYRNHPPEKFITEPTNIRHHLFTTYINRMFDRRSLTQEPDKSQSTHYLSWLASQMQAHDQSTYYLENTQPTWLGERQQIFSILFGLVCGLFIGLVGWLLTGLYVGLIAGLVGGFSCWLFFGRDGIMLTEALMWSSDKGLPIGAKAVLIIGVFAGVSAGLYVGIGFGEEELITGIMVGLITVPIAGVVSALSFGLFFGLILGLIGGLSPKDIQIKVKPNQGLWLSGRNAVLVALGVALIGGLFGGILFWFISGTRDVMLEGVFYGLLLGLFGGLLTGMNYGGFAFIQHFILRSILARYNYLPFKLVPFLDEMASRLILRKVGGGYIFIHRMLLDYFADLEKDESSADD